MPTAPTNLTVAALSQSQIGLSWGASTDNVGVAYYRIRRNGTEIAQLGPGDIMGEAAIVNHSLRTASIVALTPLELIHFTDEAVRRLCEEVPAFADALRTAADERLGRG